MRVRLDPGAELTGSYYTKPKGAEMPKRTTTLRVVFHIDVNEIRDAEKLLDAWLAPQGDDDQLISYEVEEAWTNQQSF